MSAPQAILAVDESERASMMNLLQAMGFAVHYTSEGKRVVHLLEDYDCNLLLINVQLSDMHAWTLLDNLRNIVNLAGLPTIVMMDSNQVSPVHVTSVVRPIANTSLKQIIRDLYYKHYGLKLQTN